MIIRNFSHFCMPSSGLARAGPLPVLQPQLCTPEVKRLTRDPEGPGGPVLPPIAVVIRKASSHLLTPLTPPSISTDEAVITAPRKTP